MITDDSCWADYRISADEARGRPALFLDRDGVLIEDTGYPHRPADVVLIPALLNVVKLACDHGFVVGIVTNQSGIGRGLFEWPAFAEVQKVIDGALASLGAGIDFVLACPYHADASELRFRRIDHDWRKPAPGMIVAAAATLGLDLSRSAMIGDRTSDMEAAQAAGVAHRLLLADIDQGAMRSAAWHTTSRSAAGGAFRSMCRL